jgi:hypothetical protein
MSDYKKEYKSIIRRIREARRRETLLMMLGAALLAITITSIVALVASAIETIANGNEVFRGVLFASMALTLVVSAGLLLAGPVMRALGIKGKPTYEQIAIRIGNVYPEIHDRLCNVIQLVRDVEKPTGTSQQLALAAFREISRKTEKLDFNAIIEKRRPFRFFAIFAITALVTGLVMGVIAPSVGEAFGRIINFNKSYLPPAPFSLSIEPISAIQLRGEPATITVRATGEAPDKIIVYIKEPQQESYDAFTIKADSAGVFNYKIASLKQSISFYAEAQWLISTVATQKGEIQVIDRPQVRSLAGRIIFPSYTGLGGKDFNEQSADFSALTGSAVDIQILANKDLASAQIMIETNRQNSDSVGLKPDTTAVEMNIDGKKAHGVFHIRSSCNYWITLTDASGEKNNDAIKYNIIATTDEYPSISMITPVSDVNIGEDAKLRIRAALSDDYGFTALRLNYRLAESKYLPPQEKFESLAIPINISDVSQEVEYIWDIEKLGISPEDKYEFFLEIFDNDRVSGPKSSKTRTLGVRLPSLDEVLENADNLQEKAQKELENILQKTQEIKRDAQELNRELMKKQQSKDTDWKDKKKAEDLLKKQAELQKKVADVQQSLNDIAQNLQQNNAISPETMMKYLELQQLLREVNSDELRALQQRMQQAMDQMTPEQMQKLMNQFEFNEEQFRKSIDRTMKLLKRMQAEQKVDALAKRAEELAKQQDEIQKQLESANPNDKKKIDELAAKQQAAKDELQNILKDINELEKLMKEIGKDMPLDELQAAEQELSPQDAMNEMNDAQNNMQKGDTKKAGNSCKNSSNRMKKFAQKMKSMKEAMEKDGKREAMRKMQKAINDMLELSKKQEDLKSQTQTSDYNSTQLPDIAAEQAEILESLQNVANSMMELSQKSFSVTPDMAKSLGDAMQSMQDAMKQLSDRQTQSAAKSQNSAMSEMNKGAMEMQASLSAMSQSSGSCSNPNPFGQGQSGQGQSAASLGERMQQLAAQQMAINQAMQQMGSGGQMSPEQQAQLGRIAGEQGSAQKSLEELSKEQKQFGQSEKRGLGNLEKIAQEMQETVKDLQSGKITSETMKRQERILQRLLDASKSIHDRDFEKKREGRSADNINSRSPADFDLSTQEGRTRAFQEMIRSIQQGYTKDYEALIRQYFESLQRNTH